MSALSRRALLAGLAALAASSSRACGFDGAVDAGFGYVHPRALDVALAVRRAVSDGALDADALTPGTQGLWQASEDLRRFGAALSAAPSTARRSSFALLLAEAALWTRYTPHEQGYDCRIHASGPAAEDVVLVTDRAVLAAINAGRVSTAEAIGRSLLVIEAPNVVAPSAFLAAVAPVRTGGLEARAAFGGR